MGCNSENLASEETLRRIAVALELSTTPSSDAVPFIATENIPAFSFVTSTGKVVDSNLSGTRNKNIGISHLAVLNTFAGTVQQTGFITNLAWTWTTGDIIYINSNTIANFAPSSGYTQCVGTAVNSNTIEINIHTAYTL